MSKPFPEMLTMPLRKMRADRLTAYIMHIIGDRLERHDERNHRRDVARELFAAFYDSGIEIITDEDRKTGGLPPRGECGLTHHELQIMEAKRMEAMLRPIQITPWPLSAPEETHEG